MRHFTCSYYGLFLFVLALGSWQTALAQDPLLSQYFHYRVVYNPAMTNYEGGMQGQIFHRNQWARTGWQNGDYGRFTTQGASFSTETPCRVWNFGLLYLDNTEGIGDMKWQHFGLSAAYRSPELGEGGKIKHQFSAGFKVSYNMYSLTRNNDFLFSDQFDNFSMTNPISGFWAGNNPLLPSSFVDVDLGAVWVAKGLNGDRLRIGAAVHHFSIPDRSVIGVTDLIGSKPVFHVSYLWEETPERIGIDQVNYMMKWEAQNWPANFRVVPPFNVNRDPVPVYHNFQAGVIGTFRGITRMHLGAFLQGSWGTPEQVNEVDNIYSATGLVGADMPLGKFNMRLGLSYDMSFMHSDVYGSAELSVKFIRSAFSFNKNCQCGPFSTGRKKLLMKYDPF